jgi:hypothetical protein
MEGEILRAVSSVSPGKPTMKLAGTWISCSPFSVGGGGGRLVHLIETPCRPPTQAREHRLAVRSFMIYAVFLSALRGAGRTVPLDVFPGQHLQQHPDADSGTLKAWSVKWS